MYRPGNLYQSLTKDKMLIEYMVVSYKHSAGRSGELTHCAASLAHDYYRLTDKQWNAASGSEYFAAMLAFIVFNKLW